MNRRGTRIIAGLAVAVVAIVAAAVSYTHMLTLALEAGQGGLSYIEPLSVDGLLVGASLVITTREKPGWLAWLAVVVGLAVSLAANLAAASTGVVAHVVSAWPAISLALSYEVLLSLLRRQPATVVDQRERSPEPRSIATLEPAVATVATEQPPTELDRAREIVTRGRAEGVPIGRNRLARELGVTPGKARSLLSQLRDQHDQPVTTTPPTVVPAPA